MNAAIRDLDKGYLVQRVNGLHVSDGDREGALVRLHGEMQGDGDLVRLLLIRANEQKAGMQLDRPRRFSALRISNGRNRLRTGRRISMISGCTDSAIWRWCRALRISWTG